MRKTLFEWLTARVLRFMRVPPPPAPPAGRPGSATVFRAGINHYRLRVVRWLFAQTAALISIGFSLVFLHLLEARVEGARRGGAPAVVEDRSAVPPATPSALPGGSRASLSRRQGEALDRFLAGTPLFVIPFIRLVEFTGVGMFLLQALMTLSIVRLEFEQHWHIVTDRSLRIRTGIVNLQESTISFANIQQVEIRQGPLQRVLGLADVCVRSAGGGDVPTGASSLHIARFAGVTNAQEIRDLIHERLQRFREAGLGDPEERAPAWTAGSLDEAVGELLDEARRLRLALA